MDRGRRAAMWVPPQQFAVMSADDMVTLQLILLPVLNIELQILVLGMSPLHY